jgi:hypothetical protein
MSEREDNKCQALTYYSSKAEAQAEADKLTSKIGAKFLAYPCDCMGYHVERVGPTPSQQAADELAAALGHDGQAINAVLHMRAKDIESMRRAHLRKRRVEATVTGRGKFVVGCT